MSTDLLKLGIIFIIIIFLTWRKLGLDLAMLGGTVTLAVLYLVHPVEVLKLSARALTSRSTIEMISAFYLITVVQRILQARKRMEQAEDSVGRLFQSHRANAMTLPFFIGFLPSAGAVLLAAPTVRKASGSHLSISEQAFVTSYYRHIAEAFLPTYTSILLALQLSGQSMAKYIIGMIPLVIVLFVLGYFFYVRKIPRIESMPIDSKGALIKGFFQGLWPIIMAVLLITALSVPVWLSVLLVIALQIIVERVKRKELLQMSYSALEPRILLMIVFVMIFKELLESTGAVQRIADGVRLSHLSPVLIFSIIFFFASLLIGSSGTIALFIPMAFAAIPGAGITHLILFMSMAYIAMQIAPTHVCIGIVLKEFDISLHQIIQKTMPILIIFIMITWVYYQFLEWIL